MATRGGRRSPNTKIDIGSLSASTREPGPRVYWVHADGRRAVAEGNQLKVISGPEPELVDPGPGWRVEW